MRVVLMVLAYLALTVTPLGLAWLQGSPARPFRDELSSGLALTAFAILLLEFLLSGRFQVISERLGMDVTMRYHQLLARTAAIFIVIHPFLYATPMGIPRPDDVTRLGHLGLSGWSIMTGIAGWLLLLLLVITAIFRDRIGHTYESWRLSHAIGAVLIAGFSAHHAMAAGRYSSEPALTAFWFALLALAGLTILTVYGLRPLLRLRRPYEVAAVNRIAEKTWQLDLKPRRGDALWFRAGQFVWLRVGRNPASLVEHPFSVASAPNDRGQLSFIIKEQGDFTATLGGIAPGTTAYVDGPYGHLTLRHRKCAGVALIAGGVGIAPLLSILRQMKATGDRRPVVLVYGNRHWGQVVHAEELLALAKDLPLKIVYRLSEPPPGWPDRAGMVDDMLLRELFGFAGAGRWCYFLCGPPAMIEAAERSLLGLGIPGRQIVSERFNYD